MVVFRELCRPLPLSDVPIAILELGLGVEGMLRNKGVPAFATSKQSIAGRRLTCLTRACAGLGNIPPHTTTCDGLHCTLSMDLNATTC